MGVGEPVLHSDEENWAEVKFVPETACLNVLDEVVVRRSRSFIADCPLGGRCASRSMPGLERVLCPRRTLYLASGTRAVSPPGGCARRDAHQLIAANQREAEDPVNGSANGHVEAADPEEEDADFGVVDEGARGGAVARRGPGRDPPLPVRHPTASGKTIAAAGFVEAARTMGVLILTHRRLLVSQFNRELAAEGYGDRLIRSSSRARPRPSRRRSPCRRTRGSPGTTPRSAETRTSS